MKKHEEMKVEVLSHALATHWMSWSQQTITLSVLACAIILAYRILQVLPQFHLEDLENQAENNHNLT